MNILLLEAHAWCVVSFQLYAIYGGMTGSRPPAALYINPLSRATAVKILSKTNNPYTENNIGKLHTSPIVQQAKLRHLLGPVQSWCHFGRIGTVLTTFIDSSKDIQDCNDIAHSTP